MRKAFVGGLGRAVGRGVVDDDRFVRCGLLFDRCKQRREVVGAVVVDDADSDRKSVRAQPAPAIRRASAWIKRAPFTVSSSVTLPLVFSGLRPTAA